MQEAYYDNYSTTFPTIESMHTYHVQQSGKSQWERTPITALRVAALDKESPLYQTRKGIAEEVTPGAVEDTAQNMKLALKFGDNYYPMRDTAWKSLLDRAKINGSVLPHLPKDKLAQILNTCLRQHSKSKALVLVRDEKISATHSGDIKDYAILPIDKLLEIVMDSLGIRFPGYKFESGFTTHSITGASWTMPSQCEKLLGQYRKALEARNKTMFASKLMPGVQFVTSDTGVSSAKISAVIYGMEYPIHIGSVLAVEHRYEHQIDNFAESMDQLFVQYEDSVARLTKLTGIVLNYPVNAMAAVAKKLSLPKKPRDQAVEMFEMGIGNAQATAHDVFIALQEVIFNLKIAGASHADITTQQENLARAITLNWRTFDTVKRVS